SCTGTRVACFLLQPARLPLQSFLGHPDEMKIEDYGFLSDTQTGALVGRNGSVDWLCFPRFDSGACFAALLGERKNGRWLIAPADESAKVTRKYRGHTLILETTFETKDGAVR